MTPDLDDLYHELSCYTLAHRGPSFIHQHIEPSIQAEVDRYIASPAQAVSYKLGQLKFRELRAQAQAELGPKFDVRTFHDEMLNGGVLPLGMLDARTNSWIAAQKAAKTTVVITP
jgi:hypothetical protein